MLAVAPLLFTVQPGGAQPVTFACQPPSTNTNPPGDFLTGGGFILLPGANGNSVHANFGVGGGCKQGGDGHGLWGHLEYIDHGSILTGGAMLNAHWTMITAYAVDIFGDSRARFICGTATTNSPTPLIPSTVNFAVRAADDSGSGTSDKFDIQLTNPTSIPIANAVVYTTFGTGSPPPFHPLVGGNIILHKPNPSTMGSINNESCPAFPAVLNTGTN